MNPSIIDKTSLPASSGKNTGKHENAQKDGINAQKVHRSKPQGGKDTAGYWLKKVQKPEGCAHFGVQISFRGERHRFPLHTAEKGAAAERARERFVFLVGNGWPATLAKFKPEVVAKVKSSTVGGLLRAVESVAGFKPVTLATYARCLRQIVAGIAGIGDQPKTDESGEPVKDRRGRIEYLSRRHGAGNEAWLRAVDAMPVSVLTPAAIQKWRVAYVAAAGDAPDARRSAETTMASIIRNARVLFGERALEHAKQELTLPEPLPFAGVKLPKKQSTRYKSRIDAGELISAARSELTGEPLKIFALAMGYGLRKREIDLLKWCQVDFSKRVLRVEATDVFEAKSEDSNGEVDLDDEMLTLLQGWRAGTKGEFVIHSECAVRHSSKRAIYRCETHFETLYAWLRQHGITSRKPLHELRKEVGSILATRHGIFHAQSVLRHAQISTTAAFYADKKSRITAGLGALLAAPATNVIEGEFNAAPTTAKQIERKGAA
jgi:integrase